LAKYITNELGEINETNKLSFPCLYYSDEFECTNVMVEMI